MAARKNFEITSTRGHVATKHAWNASLRHIESLVRDLAKAEATTYVLQASESVKGEDGNHVQGTRTWNGLNGKLVTFTVRKA